MTAALSIFALGLRPYHQTLYNKSPYESSVSAIAHPLGKPIIEPYLTRYRLQIEWNVPASECWLFTILTGNQLRFDPVTA
jgi:hypothetical protein